MSKARDLGDAIPFGFVGVQFLTGSGTYTPTANTTTALLILQGAGGGGGGAGTTSGTGCGGGGAQGETRFYTLKQVSGTYAYTAGAGGAGGVGNQAGATGGNTFFGVGPLVNAAGGGGGGGVTGSGWGAVGTLVTGSGGANATSSALGSNGDVLASGHGRGGSSLFSTGILNSFFIYARYAASPAACNGSLVDIGWGSGGTGGGHASGTAQCTGGTGGNGFILVIEFGNHVA